MGLEEIEQNREQFLAIKRAVSEILDLAPELFSLNGIRAHLLAQGYVASENDVVRAFQALYLSPINLLPGDFTLTMVRKEYINGNS